MLPYHSSVVSVKVQTFFEWLDRNTKRFLNSRISLYRNLNDEPSDFEGAYTTQQHPSTAYACYLPSNYIGYKMKYIDFVILPGFYQFRERLNIKRHINTRSLSYPNGVKQYRHPTNQLQRMSATSFSTQTLSLTK